VQSENAAIKLKGYVRQNSSIGGFGLFFQRIGS
jgi:hypothetical protein